MSRGGNNIDIETGNCPSPQTPLLGDRPDVPQISSNPLRDIHTIFFNDYINILLVFLPFALISGALEWSSTIVFITNFFALMPLAALLSFATEELSKRVGPGLGGLLNVTFGNATELIVGIVALRDGQVKLIQTTMLGSILSSLLFVSLSIVTITE
jgi:Ca2+:H+ antiporter